MIPEPNDDLTCPEKSMLPESGFIDADSGSILSLFEERLNA